MRRYFWAQGTHLRRRHRPALRRPRRRRTKVFIGDQEDREFLRLIAAEVGPIDVLIEDGGHRMRQQIATFEEFYPHVKEDGVFLVEDAHELLEAVSAAATAGTARSSSTPRDSPTSSTAALARGWHAVDDFTRTTKSMHFYDSIVVFEKGAVAKPTPRRPGVVVPAQGSDQ